MRLHALSLLFGTTFISTKAYHLGRNEPSSPVSCCAPPTYLNDKHLQAFCSRSGSFSCEVLGPFRCRRETEERFHRCRREWEHKPEDIKSKVYTFLNGPIPASFKFSSDNKRSILIFVDDWFQTVDLWSRRRLLYQMCFNHYAQAKFILLPK